MSFANRRYFVFTLKYLCRYIINSNEFENSSLTKTVLYLECYRPHIFIQYALSLIKLFYIEHFSQRYYVANMSCIQTLYYSESL